MSNRRMWQNVLKLTNNVITRQKTTPPPILKDKIKDNQLNDLIPTQNKRRNKQTTKNE